MQALTLADVERMIHLVAEASDPTLERPLPDRKRALLTGTTDLIDGDVWIWSTAVLNTEVDRDVMSIGFVEGGWKSEQQRVHAVRQLTDPRFNAIFTGPVFDAVARGRYTTYFDREIIAAEDRTYFEQSWKQTSLGSCILSIYPLNDNVYSSTGFHRCASKPPFTERERMIVHAIYQQVDWLHREGSNVKAKDHVVRLSPRERHVLCFLMTGNSRKEIAHKLQLSEHTVGDYLKQIYKRFNVNSRTELLAQFISGGQLN